MVELQSLDFAGAERELSLLRHSSYSDFDDYFYREWVRHLFEQAVERLSRQSIEEGKQVHFALFERYDLVDSEIKGSITYAELGEPFGLTATQVTNYLAWARRRFRSLVQDGLRSSTGNEEEFRIEAARLFGEGRM